MTNQRSFLLGSLLGILACYSVFAHAPLWLQNLVEGFNNLEGAKLGQIGPFIGGISLAVAAIAALLTLFLYNRKEREQAWLDSFRALYAAFWDSREMAQVRGWIVSDVLYREIQEVLRKRNLTGKFHNNLSAAENAKIDKIDRFCAIMVRAQSFGNSFMMSRRQRKLWSKLLYNEVWATRNRIELAEYINTHWQEIATFPQVGRIKFRLTVSRGNDAGMISASSRS